MVSSSVILNQNRLLQSYSQGCWHRNSICLNSMLPRTCLDELTRKGLSNKSGPVPLVVAKIPQLNNSHIDSVGATCKLQWSELETPKSPFDQMVGGPWWWYPRLPKLECFLFERPVALTWNVPWAFLERACQCKVKTPIQKEKGDCPPFSSRKLVASWKVPMFPVGDTCSLILSIFHSQPHVPFKRGGLSPLVAVLGWGRIMSQGGLPAWLTHNNNSVTVLHKRQNLLPKQQVPTGVLRDMYSKPL